MKIEKWLEENTHSLKGKTICITGSTGDLAQIFTEKLAKMGANFVFANRNREKSEKQKKQLLEKYPDIKIQIFNVDFNDLNSVKLLVCKLKQVHIDILILNSAVYNVPRKTTNSGYDNIFQVNFVSQYYIAKQLLSNLRKIKNSKIVVIGSIAHNYSKVNFDDIQKLKTKKSSVAYGNSKRFLMASMQKLLENHPVELSVVHPGVTLTKMTSHYPFFINWLVKIGIKVFFPKPEKACLSVLSGVFNTTQTNEWIGPKKHNIWGYPKKQKLKTISTDESSKIFFEAEKIYSDLTK
jgi:short-subunit dehydrogenase